MNKNLIAFAYFIFGLVFVNFIIYISSPEKIQEATFTMLDEEPETVLMAENGITEPAIYIYADEECNWGEYKSIIFEDDEETKQFTCEEIRKLIFNR